MSDPMDRLSGADPELGRAVPPTPVFAGTEGTPLFAGPLRAVLIAAAVVLVIGIPVRLLGGGGDDVVAPATSPTTSSTPAPSTTTEPETTSTTGQASTSTVASIPEWEGEPFDFWVPVPDEGAVLGVVGVRWDDLLNVRSGPGASFDVVGELDPMTAGIWGTGRGWQLPGGDVWWEIESGGVTGWVNQRYLSRLGGTDDITSWVVAAVGPLEAPTLEELAIEVAASRGDTSLPASARRDVITAPATEGDLGEITIDVLGFGDDSVGGERLHIFAVRIDGGWALKSVEATTFCQRGVSGELCV